MVLVQKWPFFDIFFLGNIGQENVFYDILQRKIAFLGYQNKKFKQSKNWNIFEGVNPWFWSKHGHFCNFFLLGNVGKENDFCDLLERKIAFLGYKNKKFKSWKIDIFPNEWTHGFGPKTAIFPAFFFLRNIGQENDFCDILDRKNAFVGYKNKNFKKLKNLHFSKGVNPWF